MGKFDAKDQDFASIFFGRRLAASKDAPKGKTVTAQAVEDPNAVKKLPWDNAVVVPVSDYGNTQKRLFAAVSEKIKKYRVAGAEIKEESFRIHEVEKLLNGATATRYAKAIYSISLPTSHPHVRRTIRAAAFYDGTKRDPVDVDGVVYDEHDQPLAFNATTFDRLAVEIPDAPSAKGSLVLPAENGGFEEIPSKNVEAAAEALAAKGIEVKARWIDRVYGERYGCICRFVDAPAERIAEVIETVKRVDAAQDAKEDKYDERADEKKSFPWAKKDYDDRAGEKGKADSNWTTPAYDDRASQKGKDSAVTAAYGTEAAMQRTEKKVSGRGAPEALRMAQVKDCPKCGGKLLHAGQQDPKSGKMIRGYLCSECGASFPASERKAQMATDDPYEGSATGKPGAPYEYPDADTRKPSKEALDKPEVIEGEADAPRAADDPYKGEGKAITKFVIPDAPASKEAINPEVAKDEAGVPRATDDPYAGQAKDQGDKFTSEEGGKPSKEATELSPAAKVRKARRERVLAEISRMRAVAAAARAKK